MLEVFENFSREWSHQICDDQLKRTLDHMVGCLWIGELVTFLIGANVKIGHGFTETHAIVIRLL